jgi:hypothetical protein
MGEADYSCDIHLFPCVTASLREGEDHRALGYSGVLLFPGFFFLHQQDSKLGMSKTGGLRQQD